MDCALIGVKEVSGVRVPEFTYYNIPFLFAILGWPARLLAFLLGWKIIGDMKPYDKCVLIGAPHTSNWDYLIFLWGILVLGLRVNVLVKDSLFRPPLSFFLRFFGGVPVDRTRRESIVEQGVAFLKRANKTVLLIAPEGTRAHNKKWKTGFYHIALGAEIPLVLARLDWSSRTLYIGEAFDMSGDYDKDIMRIKAYFKGAKGLRPQNQDI